MLQGDRRRSQCGRAVYCWELSIGNDRGPSGDKPNDKDQMVSELDCGQIRVEQSVAIDCHEERERGREQEDERMRKSGKGIKKGGGKQSVAAVGRQIYSKHYGLLGTNAKGHRHTNEDCS